MTIVRKFTIGVMPFAKMFRMRGIGGAATDAVLKLRSRGLPDEYFAEVGSNPERTAYRMSSADQVNAVALSEEHVAFSKTHYEAGGPFDFKKSLDEFRLVWNALNSVVQVTDIRRIGIVCEYRYVVDGPPSVWLRRRLTTLDTSQYTDGFSLRFEERALARDGVAPDPKKADFINTIYNFYDSSKDGEHPVPGFVTASLDVQRYFAPVFNGNVGDEVLKLYKTLCATEKQFDGRMKSWGAAHAER
jgi:hypothetical protein